MYALKVPKKEANHIRLILLEHELLSLDWKIKSNHHYVYLPLKKVPEEQFITEIDLPQSSVVETDFEKIKKTARSFEELLQDRISPSKMDDLKKSFDIIGEVVILEIPPELEDDKTAIGEAALNFTKRRSVYLKKSEIKGVTRIREFEHLAGEDNSITVHKEFGSQLRLDVKNMYFSPRLATERKIVADQVQNGEFILDMFCGVGPYTILIARQKEVQIWAVDINSPAIHYLKQNIALNKVQEKVRPFPGNIRNILQNRDVKFDRIIMNLPGSAKDFLPLALEHLKKGGIIHYYEFSRDPEQSVENIKNTVHPSSVEITGIRKVKSKSPGVWQLGIDFRID